MIPSGWRCPRRVGFLFPHPCERLSPAGCPDCENGQIADPYASRPDRGGYETDYGDYTDLGLGTGDEASATMSLLESSDFTEADGESLMRPAAPFEDDFSAS